MTKYLGAAVAWTKLSFKAELLALPLSPTTHPFNNRPHFSLASPLGFDSVFVSPPPLPSQITAPPFPSPLAIGFLFIPHAMYCLSPIFPFSYSIHSLFPLFVLTDNWKYLICLLFKCSRSVFFFVS